MKEILIQEKADEERNKEIMAILFDVGKTLARQSLAFRGSGKDEDGNYVQMSTFFPSTVLSLSLGVKTGA